MADRDTREGATDVTLTEWRPDHEWMWDEPVGWSRVGDWIWKHLCADENPDEIKRKLALYVDELHTRSLDG